MEAREPGPYTVSRQIMTMALGSEAVQVILPNPRLIYTNLLKQGAYSWALENTRG